LAKRRVSKAKHPKYSISQRALRQFGHGFFFFFITASVVLDDLKMLIMQQKKEAVASFS
jgi:hypothetical protein